MARRHPRYRSAAEWGRMDRLTNPPALLIFNFETGSAHLNIEHRQYLHEVAVPKLKAGDNVTIIGLASRRGATAHNLRLSQLRAGATFQFLHGEIGPALVAQPTIGVGEMKAKEEGYAPNDNDPRFRSVVLMFGTGPTPPFPPALIDVTPRYPEDSTIPQSFEWDFPKTIDSLNGLAQFLELMPWEKLAAFGENMDLFTAVIGAAIGMPSLWMDVREQNRNNGRLQGYWESFQDMANQYSDPTLSTTPLKQWPVLRQARPRPLPAFDGSLNQREWMEGKQEACETTFEVVQIMERKPEIKEGWEITGRRYLFMLWYRFRNSLADGIHQEVDKRLREKGNHKWPLYR
jgi:hypothetical protein